MEKLENIYRPRLLNEIKGNEETVSLVKSWFTRKSLPKVMIMQGAWGCGKTTTARIVAKWANCDNPTNEGPCCSCESCLAADKGINPDILEIDAAGNNKVEDVHEVLDMIQYTPFYNKKVVIFDEVQQLSKQAFDTLLKPLEETPEHCIIMFCTTELQKIPQTIKSRGQILTFKSMSVETTMEHLVDLLDKNDKKYDRLAIEKITLASNGSMRDAVKNLSLFMDDKFISEDVVERKLGIPSEKLGYDILNGIFTSSYDGIKALREATARGVRSQNIVDDLIKLGNNCCIYKLSDDISAVVGTENYKSLVKSLSDSCEISRFVELVDSLKSIRTTGVSTIVVESNLLAFSCKESYMSLLERRIMALEQKISGAIDIIPVVAAEKAIEACEKITDESVDMSVIENKNETPEIPKQEGVDYLTVEEDAYMAYLESTYCSGDITNCADINNIEEAASVENSCEVEMPSCYEEEAPAMEDEFFDVVDEVATEDVVDEVATEDIGEDATADVILGGFPGGYFL